MILPRLFPKVLKVIFVSVSSSVLIKIPLPEVFTYNEESGLCVPDTPAPIIVPPFMCNVASGAVIPIPTFPLPSIVNLVFKIKSEVEDAILNLF